MATGFKTRAAAVKWLESVFGVYLEEGSAEGKWAAYVPYRGEMAIGYGDDVLKAITAAQVIVEG